MKIPIFIVFGIGACALTVYAQTGDGGQKKYGVVHNIAEDRQLERVGGIYEPEGIDKYMKRRFDALSDQIKSLDSRLSALESKTDEILKRMDNTPQEQGKVSRAAPMGGGKEQGLAEKRASSERGVLVSGTSLGDVPQAG